MSADPSDSEAEGKQLLSKQLHDTADSSAAVYETAIAEVGYGWFHYGLVALCGWALCSDAIEVLSISFILPAATCDLHLTAADKGLLTAVIFAGMMVGGYLWGMLADIYGRRAVLLYSLTVNSLGGLASSFAQNFMIFTVLRFISGIGVGGSLPVVFAYFTEFQPKHKRGSMIVLLATFWMSGNCIAAGLAWVVVPAMLPAFHSWRLYLALCTVPALSAALGYACMPESPKFLMQTGRVAEAVSVFEHMYKSNRNTGKLNTRNLFACEESGASGEVRIRNATACCSSVTHTLKQFWLSTVQMFKPPLTRISIVMVIIYFTLSFGYYGMYMWFPELFARMEAYGGTPCNLATPGIQNLTNHTQPCDSNVSQAVYFQSFLTAISNLPGNLLAIFLIDRVGRKVLLVCSMVLSGVSVFFIATLTSATHSLIFSCIFGAISTIGWDSLDVIGVELYPTQLRSTASGLLMGVGRVAAVAGNLAFGALVDTYCLVPMMMVALLLALGGLASLLLPGTTHIDLT